MNKYISTITIVLSIIILLTFSSFSNFNLPQPKAINIVEINLEDGENYNFHESLNLDYDFIDGSSYSRNVDYSGNEIFNSKDLQFINSPIIRSFETENNDATDIVKLVNLFIDDDELGYTNILNQESLILQDEHGAFIVGDNSYKKGDNIVRYIHTLFQNKTARKILYEEGLTIVKNLCEIVPNDFKKRVINELSILLAYSSTLSTKKYDESQDFSDWWKGFLYRRYFIDKVPISEIQSCLLKAKNELNALKIVADFSYEIRVNNEVSIFVNNNDFALFSLKNNKLIHFQDDIPSSISIFKDGVNSFYNIKTKKCFYCDESKLLYDSKLNLIE